MCRNIRVLFNFEPPASEEEVRAAALQYVRKISGYAGPSAANEAAFNRAVDDVADVSARLIDSLVTSAPPRDREKELAKARERAVRRFGAARRAPRAPCPPLRSRSSPKDRTGNVTMHMSRG